MFEAVIIFLLIHGDPSLALRDDRTLWGSKRGKKMCIKSSPSKGGEIYQTNIQYFTFCFVLNSLAILLYFTP
jgi:hypothetical protein